MQLSSLHIYPVKSGRVINLETAVVEQIGLHIWPVSSRARIRVFCIYPMIVLPIAWI